MEIFYPALFVAIGILIIWIPLLTALFKEWETRIYAYILTAAVAAIVYTTIVGFAFGEYATDYLPDYLVRLFM